MSVVVNVQILVTGTDDAEAVRDALHARDRYHFPEFGHPVWDALADAKFIDVDVETEFVTVDEEPDR